MKNKNSEAAILKKIINQLEFYKYSKDIVWYMRITAGVLNMGYQWIKMAKAGTPDIISIVRRNDSNLSVLFLEVKRHGTTTLRYEQREFFKEMEGHKYVYCRVINDHKQLLPIIKEVQGG